MGSIIAFIHANVAMAPFVVFGLLMLAGLNVPISEDAMIFLCAVLAKEHPDHLIRLFLGVYVGAYLSGLLCYSLGRILGPRIWKIRFFKNMITVEKMAKIHNFFEHYGLITFIIGRFIPFGVRNAMFLSAGFSKMRILRFMLSDLLACTIACSVYFYLYYTYGEAVIEEAKKFHALILILLAIGAFYFLIKAYQKRRPRTSRS